MIVLAHNASVSYVPFDFETLMKAARGSAYLEALDLVVGQVTATRNKAATS